MEFDKGFENVVYNCDCLDLMDEMIRQDIKVDMILCDLPYGVTQNKKDVTIPLNDYIILNDKIHYEKDFLLEQYKKGISYKISKKYFNENKKNGLWHYYENLIKENGCIALFGQGLFYNELINSNKKMFRYDLVWDKVLTSGFLNAKRMPLRNHEQIAIFYKKQPIYNPQFTKGEPLHGKGNSYKNKKPKNQNYGEFNIVDDVRKGCTDKYPKSILKFPKKHPSKALHPTEKSIELCEWLIKTYTNNGDLVLDNCIGSGTTAVSCINNDRKFIGADKNKENYNISIRRINNEIKLKID